METLIDDGAVAEIKSQWKQMWRERIDDRFRAEGVAFENYDKLFVERGNRALVESRYIT